jgi:hypothetical protein
MQLFKKIIDDKRTHIPEMNVLIRDFNQIDHGVQPII